MYGDHFMLVPVNHLFPFINDVPVYEGLPIGFYPFIINNTTHLQTRPNLWLLISRDYLPRNVTLKLIVLLQVRMADIGGIDEDFFGIFASEVCASLEHLHGSANPLFVILFCRRENEIGC